MQVTHVLWKQRFVEKLRDKHDVSMEEVEDALDICRCFRKVGKGKIKGEDLYSALAQTAEGRYLIIFFIHKGSGTVLPISARDMDRSERKYYERQR